MDTLFMAHSGLRYLVLLAGAAAVLWLGWRTFSGAGSDRAGRGLTAAFLGTLDLQLVLGLALFLGGRRPEGIHLHMTLMILAAVAGHVGSVVAKRGTPRPAPALAGAVLALGLIAGGILAIRDSVF